MEYPEVWPVPDAQINGVGTYFSYYRTRSSDNHFEWKCGDKVGRYSPRINVWLLGFSQIYQPEPIPGSKNVVIVLSRDDSFGWSNQQPGSIMVPSSHNAENVKRDIVRMAARYYN